MRNKTVTFTIICVAALCCLADDQRTFFQVGDKIYSATNGWNLVKTEGGCPLAGEVEETDEDGNVTFRFVTPHRPMVFQLKNAFHEQITFLFSSSLAGSWTNRSYIITGPTPEPLVESPGFVAVPKGQWRKHLYEQKECTTNFFTHQTSWDQTNGLLTSAAVDFQGGKVRFNSDIP